jgi:hypothetical protein
VILKKSEVNFREILNSCAPKHKLPFERHKDEFIKIAFDVYAPKSDPSDNLWVLQKTDDGEFLVRTNWDHDNVNVKESHDSGWSATPSKGGGIVTLYYKDLPLINLSAEEYGFSEGDTRGFIRNLIKFMGDRTSVAKLLKELPQNKVAAFVKKANLNREQVEELMGDNDA